LILASQIHWAKHARQIVEGMGNPDTLFNWPFARVLLVYFDGFGDRVVNASEALEIVNRKRAAKNLPLLDKLPFGESRGPNTR
jgi:hypothetical protein